MYLAVGDYSIVMDNGPARNAGVAQTLQAAGEQSADMFEVTIDYPVGSGFIWVRGSGFRGIK